MADWPLLGGGRTQFIRSAFSLTVPGSNNTKGAWAELTSGAGASFDVAGFLINISLQDFTGNLTKDALVDFGVGAAGSEQVIIPDLPCHDVTTSLGTEHIGMIYVPICVPAGALISARYQSNVAANSVVAIGIRAFGQGFLPSQPPTRVLAWGVTAATTSGTSIEPGATINTKGAWSQLVASTEADIVGLALSFGNQANAARTECTWHVDVGVGAAGSEQIVCQDVRTRALVTGTAPGFISPFVNPFIPVSIPAGSRIAVRAQCSINDATDRLIDAFVHGLVA